MLNVTNLSIAFYYIAVFSTILFVIKMVLFSITGGDSEVFSDFNTECEAETSFEFLSIQSVLAFLMGFGWLGLAGLKQWGIGVIPSAVVAVITGLAFMFISAYLMLVIKKLNKVTAKNYAKCIGSEAKAYTTFHPNGEGQIEVIVNGRLSVETAHNSSDIEIEAFSPVKVVDYKENKFYIERI